MYEESIEPYQKQIEEALRRSLQEIEEKTPLRDAYSYALLNGGKRLRPSLVLMVAEALNCNADVMPAALSVEYFHTASLIADDLPSMDNDDFRRGKPSLHKAFPESIALLASYTLIAAGYGGISKMRQKMKENSMLKDRADEACLFCLEMATKAAGFSGATQGQFFDLFPEEPSISSFRKMAEMKTAALFEVALLFGWVFGGGSLERAEEVKKTACHLGVAFQIGDDLDDDTQDEAHAEGTNLCRLIGKKEAFRLLEEEFISFRRGLESLSLWTPSFQELFRVLDRKRGLHRLFFGKR